MRRMPRAGVVFVFIDFYGPARRGLSMIRVKGPSLTAVTVMEAPKTPVRTAPGSAVDKAWTKCS